MKNNRGIACFLTVIVSTCMLYSFAPADKHPVVSGDKDKHPKIVNIINFIRLLEPRDAAVTQDVLYQTVVKQLAMMKQYKLGGTFLLQYDALMDKRYQQLLKNLPASFEIGGWWELPQPLIENAGMKWRGRYPWDWRANIGFSTGYTPEEREKLVDVYMADFKKIFGYYPKSVGSWFIDAHTLNYMYSKYKIVASSNCKDQIGTDGYTLWGGYWNQAYYPSKINSYMPAQNEKNQIPVPIFRMLGSDPVRQYDDNGSGSNGQGVVTLEPVYKFGGGDAAWVNWYFKEFVEGPSMEYAYVQAGQENSFTWDAMAKGFDLQLPLIARLRDEKKIRVETLAASGQWFRDHYKITPATSVTVNNDINGSNKKTVWFNSRFYRFNLLWENGNLRFRDIHLFNENFPSIYTTQKVDSNECVFFTLPFIDGYRWSSKEKKAALYFKAMVNGKEIMIEGGDPVITDAVAGKLHIVWPLKTVDATLVMDVDEKQIKMSLTGKKSVDWFLDCNTATAAVLPFTKITTAQIDCQFEQTNYAVTAAQGSFTAMSAGTAFRITPKMNTIILNLTGAGKAD